MVVPLTRIVALPARLETVPDAIAATSANAVRNASPDLVESIRKLPLFAVGDATASAAAEAGFEDVRTASGDAESLARLVGAFRPLVQRLT